jgi:hypothetical protein
MAVTLWLTLLVSLPLSLVLAAGIAWRYRAAVRQLMRLAPSPADTGNLGPPLAAAARQPAERRACLSASLRQREQQLELALALGSALIGYTGAWLYLSVHQQEFGGITPLRLLLVGLVWCTPGLILQAQVLRWSLQRQLLVLLIWGSALVLLMALASGGFRADALGLVLPQLLLPQLVLGLLFGIPGLRAIAPYLFPAVAGLCLVVIAVLPALLSFSGAAGWILLVAIAVLLLSSLAAHRLSQVIGQLYHRQVFSDLSYLYAASWLVVLILDALPGLAAGDGLLPLLPLLAWVWIPVLFRVLLRLVPPPPPGYRPPHLLVLRVFRRHGPMAWLFDHVVQRWRLMGPVLLITAADLAARTLEPHELVSFVEGRLQERYINSTEQVSSQLAQIQEQPDHDGRWRVHECCCYANSWKPTLEALLQRADAVLMDLRGFSNRNAGCCHELQRIGQSDHLCSAVLLVDRETDQVAAEQALGPQATATITWQQAGRGRIQAIDAVLKPLLHPFET